MISINVSIPEAANPRISVAGTKKPATSRIPEAPPRPDVKKSEPEPQTDQLRSAVQQLRGKTKTGRQPGDAAKEKIQRHFPRPDRGLECGEPVVALTFPLLWTSHGGPDARWNLGSFSGRFPDFLESFLGCFEFGA